MTQPSSATGGDTRLALTAGVGCYLIWGFVPFVFQPLGAMGAPPLEVLAHRTFWAIPVAALFVMMARQGAQAAAVFRQPRVLGLLSLSALIIAGNWLVYIWAVTHARVLEASLGYYINPLINMAAGALIFRERIDRVGLAAIALAVVGVAIQTAALGHLPLISVALAITFAAYGVVRKRVAADAQTGLLVECLILGVPGLAYALWLEGSGAGHFMGRPALTALLVFSGVVTAVPLVLFSWAARRIPLSAMGFLQFIAPTIVFVIGVAQGEPFTALRALSFLFIWGGAVVFIFGAWRRAKSTRVEPAAP